MVRKLASKSTTPVKLSLASEGFLRYKGASGKSENTISDYRNSLSKLGLYFTSDPPLDSITHDQLVGFFAWLQDEYVSEPAGVAPRGKIKLGPKSILNIHTNLSSFWTWAVKEDFAEDNLLRAIERPPVSDPDIEPLTKEEVVAMLKGCEASRNWKDRSSIKNNRPTAERDQLLIKLLLDTGMRAEEVCALTFEDINFQESSLMAKGKGPGRRPKVRKVFMSKRTAQTLWKYLLPRLETIKPAESIFTVDSNYPRPLTRQHLSHLIHDLGVRAGVKGAHPHKFRHTFAISYLRNGGDLLTLQMLLGHTSLDMVKRYARIAEADCAAKHLQASPVDNWKL